MGGAYQEDNIHPHFTGNDKGLYATMIGGSIDPWLYGDIRNLMASNQGCHFQKNLVDGYV